MGAVVDTNFAVMLEHLLTNVPKFVASVECERVEDPGGSKTNSMRIKSSARLGGVGRRRVSRRCLGLILLLSVVVLV